MFQFRSQIQSKPSVAGQNGRRNIDSFDRRTSLSRSKDIRKQDKSTWHMVHMEWKYIYICIYIHTYIYINIYIYIAFRCSKFFFLCWPIFINGVKCFINLTFPILSLNRWVVANHPHPVGSFARHDMHSKWATIESQLDASKSMFSVWMVTYRYTLLKFNTQSPHCQGFMWWEFMVFWGLEAS